MTSKEKRTEKKMRSWRLTLMTPKSVLLLVLLCLPYGWSQDNRVESPASGDGGHSWATPQPAVKSGDNANDGSTADDNQNGSFTTQAVNRVFVWTRNKEHYPTDGKRLEGHVFMQTDNKYANTQCAMDCLRHHKCRSFNFASESGICQLNSASHLEKPEAVTSDVVFEYHTRASYSIDEEALGPCAKVSCSGHGRCLETRSVDGGLVALCLCEEGWQGTSCNRPDMGAQWAEWMEWGTCSVTCHRGWRSRKRHCEDTNTGSVLNSFECYGSDQEYGVCQLQQCPSWKQWGEWGQCSTQTSCGRGVKKRSRECSNGGTIGVDRYCLGLSNETTPCDGPECSGPMQLTGKAVAGEGIVEIHDTLHNQWVHMCADQMTQHMADLVCRQVGWPGAHAAITDGSFGSGTLPMGLTNVQCSGSENTLTGCLHNAMTLQGGTCESRSSVPAAVQCNVNGVWSLWTSWSDCDVTCENGTRTRTRTCSHPPALHAGKPCEGEHIQVKPCSLPMCPTGWLEWSQWSDCDVWCGDGHSTRHRKCIWEDKNCEGNSTEERMCSMPRCVVNGEWNPWAAWSSCSVTCANGTQTRNRTCLGPFFGGQDCQGDWSDTQQCMDRECPVDGVWDTWGQWSDCTLTCGNGTHSRNRTCIGPFYDGKQCSGTAVNFDDCNTHHCPVDGEWKPWTRWSDCSLSCGGGQRRRMRECQRPLHGGDMCEGDGEQIKDCNMHNCPIHGVWEEWSPWGACSVTCAWGIQWRNRTCDGPYYGGDLCQGNETQSQECHARSCPVDGHWLDWQNWGQCSTSCGGGVRQRKRDCYHGQHGGQDCIGDDSDTGPCNDHHCPVDGVWQAWSGWGDCSLTCGNGTQLRNRTCHGPFYGGANCNGSEVDDQLCNTFPCPVDGVFDPWTAWEDCSVTCGGGLRSRERNCTGPFFGGMDCLGDRVAIENCGTDPCPINGSWKPWALWSACSVTCGGGLRSRDRECDEALFGGDNCTGPSQQNETCNSYHCPIDGEWNQWSLWEDCSVTCGGGNQSRHRTCSGPFYGGQDCPGDWTQTQACNTHNCPIDGVFDNWSAWAECDVTCGGGIKERSRVCIGPFYGGLDCNGTYKDNTTCNTHNCPIDGVYDSWGTWSVCSTTCGGGVKWRNRTCIGPFYGGADCQEPSDGNTTCNENPCPEDGAWLPWSMWSQCSVTCGGGDQSRDRLCNGTKHGGKYCDGNHNQTQACNTHHCPIDGVFTDWAQWTECTLTCGSGSQNRNRSCVGPFYGGAPCEGDSNETQSCNDHHCPIDGFYHNWSSWGTCRLTCGNGTQQRVRQCEEPKYGGADCQGPTNETQSCNTHNCPVDGEYEPWAAWSVCSTTCGGGTQWRNRTCIPPQYGGQECQGPDNVTQDCNTNPCPIDGVWLEWSVWGPCNVTCGGGMKERTRQCDPPKYNGTDCMGPSSEFKSCAPDACLIPGDWFPWTEWTVCTVTCGGGTRQRTRDCDMTSYGNLTSPCEGDAQENVDCHTFSCLPLARTCTELAERGLTIDTEADIDPDGPGETTLEPVVVYCEMTSHDGYGVTVVGHDQEQRHQVQGFEGAREYSVILNYNISFDHVISIVDQSEYCEQYISWECFAALIHNYNDNNKVTTGWLNRTEGIADYFGGAAPGSHSCACGMNHTCALPDEVCNCDSNDQVWRQDEGYLTHKDDLPVFAFVAGDTGEWLKEEGFFTVGTLNCYGHDTSD